MRPRIAFAALALAAAPLRAQPADTTRISHEPFFTARDAWIGASFAVATVAMFPLDRRIAHALQEPDAQGNRFLHHAATSLEKVTSPGTDYFALGFYAVGKLGHVRRLADLGLHGWESTFLAIQITDVVKGLAGRARPYVSYRRDSTFDSSDWQFARGLRSRTGYTSFPSGHTTKAFAAAAAVTAETSRWWPRSTWIIGPVMYGGASLVGLSRMYHNVHWGSDVVLGAAIGTFSGLKVVQYNHSHPHNRIDGWLLGASVVPDGSGGLVVAWSVPTR